MKRIVDYMLLRPIGTIFNGALIGLLLPLGIAGKLSERVGRVWPWLLSPVWIVANALAIPISILYCFIIVMWKGSYWQYPPDKRTSFDVSKMEQMKP